MIGEIQSQEAYDRYIQQSPQFERGAKRDITLFVVAAIAGVLLGGAIITVGALMVRHGKYVSYITANGSIGTWPDGLLIAGGWVITAGCVTTLALGIGFLVGAGCRSDWRRYDKPEVAQRTVNDLATCEVSSIPFCTTVILKAGIIDEHDEERLGHYHASFAQLNNTRRDAIWRPARHAFENRQEEINRIDANYQKLRQEFATYQQGLITRLPFTAQRANHMH